MGHAGGQPLIAKVFSSLSFQSLARVRQHFIPRDLDFRKGGWIGILCSAMLASFFPLASDAQQFPATATQQNCPLTFVKVSPDPVSVRIKNTSGKTIAGLTFYVALSDATEHWQWFHWDYDQSKPLHNFDWNQSIKPNASKKLTWVTNLNPFNGSGGALVLVSALFNDGSSWEEQPDRSSCKILWHDNHIKHFIKPILLPSRLGL